MKPILRFCILGLLISTAASANTPPADAKTMCLIEAYGIYIDAQQQAATDSAALSAKYIPESAKMAASQKNVRLLETAAEKIAFVYLVEHKQSQIAVELPVNMWTQAFDMADKTSLSTQNKNYADLIEQLGKARADNDKALEEWKKTDTVKAPAALSEYQNDLLDIGRTLNLKTRDAETHCASKP